MYSVRKTLEIRDRYRFELVAYRILRQATKSHLVGSHSSVATDEQLQRGRIAVIITSHWLALIQWWSREDCLPNSPDWL